MENLLKKIHDELGITAKHLQANKLDYHPQPSLDQLEVVEIDFEGKPFILHSEAAAAWRMMRASAFRDNIRLQPFSGFRSYLHQKKLIANHLKNGRELESILTHIAVPGFSEHHTGYAIDIHANGNPVLEEAFENSEEFSWLHENATRFGFRLSYPRSNDLGIIYEPWHWYFFTGGDSVAIPCESKVLVDHEAFIRRATIADVEGIHNAHMQSIRDVCAKDHSEAEIEAWGNRQFNREQRVSSIKNDFVWVVELDGTICGYGHIKLIDKDGLKQGHIYGLYLTTQVLGKKFGQRILSLMIERAKEFGAQRIGLESTITAHSFYGINGFRDDGPMATVKINGQDVRCYPMVLDLTIRANKFGGFHHVEIYVADLKVSIHFWSWFLGRLGYFEYQSWDYGKSYRKGDTYIVFVQTEDKYKDVKYHRCRTGLNHLAFYADSKEMVDELTQALRERKIKILYEDKHPYAGGKSYGVYFEDPDRIKIELVAP